MKKQSINLTRNNQNYSTSPYNFDDQNEIQYLKTTPNQGFQNGENSHDQSQMFVQDESAEHSKSQIRLGTDDGTGMNRNHPSIQTLELMEGAQHVSIDPTDDEETIRVKRAFQKHEKNVFEWDKTITQFQQWRYDQIMADRVDPAKQPTRQHNIHRSPSAIRTLIELQKYYEQPAMNKEESFIVKQKHQRLHSTFEISKGFQGGLGSQNGI